MKYVNKTRENEMLIIKVYENVNFYNFTCIDNGDVDYAYGVLAEYLKRKYHKKDFIALRYLKEDDDVETLLEDAKQHGFISGYDVIYRNND